MGRARTWAAVLLIAAGSVLSAAGAAVADDTYHLNPGDLLEVSVWNEETMLRQLTVLPDGTISYPLAGRLAVAGKTVDWVEGALAKKLAKFFPDPTLTVTVVEARGNRIFVIGEVRNPGAYVMNQPLDIMQALSLAGGLAEFADENAIKVLRRNGQEQVAVPFDYAALKKGRRLEENILLRSGDTVVVPPDGIF